MACVAGDRRRERQTGAEEEGIYSPSQPFPVPRPLLSPEHSVGIMPAKTGLADPLGAPGATMPDLSCQKRRLWFGGHVGVPSLLLCGPNPILGQTVGQTGTGGHA